LLRTGPKKCEIGNIKTDAKIERPNRKERGKRRRRRRRRSKRRRKLTALRSQLP
jgi:hypothetical protein